MSDDNAIERNLIVELAGLLKETGLTEIEIEKKGLRLRVAKSVTMVSAGIAQAAAPIAAAVGPAPVAKAIEPAEHPGTVKSPMVGTAYRSAAPGSAPFVEVGSKITQGSTILIIEAMKTMNQIPAPRSGTVVAVFVSDRQPVEYGEPLVVIE